MTDVSPAGLMNSPALKLPAGVPAAIIVATNLSEPAQKHVRDMLLLSLQMGATSQTIGANSFSPGVPVKEFVENVCALHSGIVQSPADEIAIALGRKSYNDLADETVLTLLNQSPTAKKLAEFVIGSYAKEPTVMVRVLSEAASLPYKEKADTIIVALDAVISKDAHDGKSQSLNNLERGMCASLLYELHKVSKASKLEEAQKENSCKAESWGYYIVPLGLRKRNVYHPAFNRR